MLRCLFSALRRTPVKRSVPRSVKWRSVRTTANAGGATNRAADLDIMTGASSAKWYKSKQFVTVLNLTERAKPRTRQIHVIIDNSSIHKAGRAQGMG